MSTVDQKPLAVLWLGAGQDSTALLYLSHFDPAFRQRYIGDSQLLVVGSDTGNEWDETYHHIADIKQFCETHQIPFHFITPDQGYHGVTWPSLPAQMERNDNIMSVAGIKSCTDNLKIKVCYRFLADYLRQQYALMGTNVQVYDQYRERFGKLTCWIGFAKGEESRQLDRHQIELFPNAIKDPRPKWMLRNIRQRYPLIELGLNRAGCQRLIAGFGQLVPPPSNCWMCPFQNDAEMVYLYRTRPDRWQYWVEREAAKIAKNSGRTRNLGVKGELLLPAVLERALQRYGQYSVAQLYEYRYSHGHCVRSKY